MYESRQSNESLYLGPYSYRSLLLVSSRIRMDDSKSRYLSRDRSPIIPYSLHFGSGWNYDIIRLRNGWATIPDKTTEGHGVGNDHFRSHIHSHPNHSDSSGPTNYPNNHSIQSNHSPTVGNVRRPRGSILGRVIRGLPNVVPRAKSLCSQLGNIFLWRNGLS